MTKTFPNLKIVIQIATMVIGVLIVMYSPWFEFYRQLYAPKAVEPTDTVVKRIFIENKKDFEGLKNTLLADRSIQRVGFYCDSTLEVQTNDNVWANAEDVNQTMKKYPQLAHYTKLMQKLSIKSIEKRTAPEPKQPFVIFDLWRDEIPTYSPRTEKGIIFCEKEPGALYKFPIDNFDQRLVANTTIEPNDNNSRFILLSAIEPGWYVIKTRWHE